MRLTITIHAPATPSPSPRSFAPQTMIVAISNHPEKGITKETRVLLIDKGVLHKAAVPLGRIPSLTTSREPDNIWSFGIRNRSRSQRKSALLLPNRRSEAKFWSRPFAGGGLWGERSVEGVVANTKPLRERGFLGPAAARGRSQGILCAETEGRRPPRALFGPRRNAGAWRAAFRVAIPGWYRELCTRTAARRSCMLCDYR